MDHRVSKDMISSGMTPSGKKSQADLGKTQYGSAPSPNKLMDAYHSMYQDQKEQTLDEKIDPMSFGKSNRTLQQKQQDRKIKNVKSGMANTGSYMDKKEVPQNKKENSTDVDNKKKDQSKGFGESNVDLLAAYYAVYEHHKKDEDGNTIPHEDDVKEGKIPAGLQAYLDKKKGKKDDKEGKKEDVKEYTAVIAKGAAMLSKAAKPVMKIAKKVDMDTVKNIATQTAIGSVMSGGNQKKEKAATVSASADLFDIVKGQLLDEGLSEEEIKDIMLTLTPEEILNEMGAKFPAGKGANYRETPKPKPQERLGTGKGADYVEKPKPKPGEPGSKFDAKGRKRYTGGMTPYSSENMKDT